MDYVSLSTSISTSCFREHRKTAYDIQKLFSADIHKFSKITC